MKAAIEKTLDGINVMNAGKKKEEALSMMKKWFPQMENFSGQLKKYKVTINDLLEENKKLESDLHNIKRLLERIPPEILEQVRSEQRYSTKDR